MDDPFDLERFVEAQAPVYERVRSELRAGRKQSHWMWFVFPQIEGLGSSAMARRFAIASREEAEAYLAHPVLGPRLLECTRLVNIVAGKEIVPEFIQHRMSARNLARRAVELLKDAELMQQMRENLLRVGSELGKTGASQIVADRILAMA